MSFYNEIMSVMEVERRRKTRIYRCKLLYPADISNSLRPERLEYVRALTYSVLDRKVNTQSAFMADIKGRDIKRPLRLFSLDAVKGTEVKMYVRLFSLEEARGF